MNHKKIKIFFFENCSDGTVGGSHYCMFNLINFFDKTNFHFTAGFYEQNSYVEKYLSSGIEVKILQRDPIFNRSILIRKLRNWYRLDYKFKRNLKIYLKNNHFDLVVINNSLFHVLNFVSVCNKLNIPIIVYERGIAPFKNKHIKASYKIALSIPISDFVKTNLIHYQMSKNHIEKIYDGIKPDRYIVNFNKDQIKQSLGLPIKSKVIGIVGNVRFWKGQEYFIEALKLLINHYPEIYGLIVGSWGETDIDFKAHLVHIIKSYNLESRIRFLGYRHDIPEILSILDVFIHASTKPEPFGMVILEAMAARVPIVATRIGGPIEILENGNCGILVPPADGHAISKACHKYLNDAEFKNAIISRAYARLIKYFNIDHTIQKTSTVFEQVYLQHNYSK